MRKVCSTGIIFRNVTVSNPTANTVCHLLYVLATVWIKKNVPHTFSYFVRWLAFTKHLGLYFGVPNCCS
jgi:hypothetical protein